MQYELMEKYGVAKRDDFPYGEVADKYWTDYIDRLMAEVEFYDQEVELNTKYSPKGIASPKDAFAFMENIVPNKNNLFLFRKHLGFMKKRENYR